MMIADLHIHSKYSRATSKDCVPEFLELWARRKGIGLVGTGDFTHPAWREELHSKLVPAEEGLYTLKEDAAIREETAGTCAPRFVVTGEISSIYKKGDRVRKVHNLILLPSLEMADALSRRLEAIGNIHSDGRPILGLDSRDLLEITLETCPEAVFIPAHIWTPHFSLFGAFSGFDTIEECFEDLAGHIHALETGLSSDPPMNWRLSALDRFHLISNSDAHSPSKLGREANLLDTDCSYPALAKALQTGEGLAGTIEFFPEEGKYHFDGHRTCKQCLTPAETAEAGGRCPVCGKKITIGVLHRVEELADREEGYMRPNAPGFQSLVPLPEVIAASTGGAAGGKKTMAQYEAMLRALGPEFYILREAPVEDIRRVAGPLVAEGIRRLRAGEVERSPGYDGEYGVIRLLSPAEREAINGQASLFGAEAPVERRRTKKEPIKQAAQPEEAAPGTAQEELNEEQFRAVTTAAPALAVIAGPGTGKTKTLVARIAWLVESKAVKPNTLTAVTFTNKAAGELRERLEQRLGKRAAHAMTIGTFHSICLELLSGQGQEVKLAGAYETLELAADILRETGAKLPPKKLLDEVSQRKNGAAGVEGADEACAAYSSRLRAMGLIDFDDLLLDTLSLWEAGTVPHGMQKRFTHLLVDEFQDIDPVQYRLICAWSKKGESLFVIGDPDQSIYGFRGSDAACFQRLLEERPGMKQISLVKNYRSTPEILSCALPVISRNGGEPRRLEPVRVSGASVRLLTAESDLSEAIFVAKEIGRMVGGIDMIEVQSERMRSQSGPQRGFSDFAVLYRTRRQGDLLEKCLARDGIPCVVAGRDDFLTDPVVRGTLCFFRLLLSPGDAAALTGCLKLVWNCPPDLVEAVSGLWRTLEGTAAQRAERIGDAYGQTAYLEQWLVLVETLAPSRKRGKPLALLEEFGEVIGCKEKEPYRRLLNMSVFHDCTSAFLEHLTIGREGDLLRSAGMAYSAGAVTLMTLHGSKGLEFPVVFLCGLQKGTVPLESQHRPTDEKEERRLFYVGMTRAKEELILLTGQEPSPFLEELPAGRFQVGRAAPRRIRPEGVQLSLF